MNEIRKDCLLDRFVIIAEGRGRRPNDFAQPRPRLKAGGACFFCPGNEGLTPPETGRVSDPKGRWLVRSFYNKFPAVSADYPCAGGSHEVLVETREHGKQMADLSPRQIRLVLDLCAERTRKLEANRGTRYVSVFKNQGSAAGTSLLHSHSQILALAEIPPLVRREADAFREAVKEGGECVFCRMAREERGGPRKIFEDENMLVLAPYASRAAYEAWFVPKRHARKFTGLAPAEMDSLALMLKKTLLRLNALFKYPSFNYYLHSACRGEDFHFHLELLPRLTVWAGFELGSGAYINPVSPETAALHLRGRRA
ncbi:MAG: DUF4931 domain-containing protein [Candidatus ainarchaeum sp.]|nr:DUF4931 domain-containing protein [Candidatus ainarchaeum sp.]